MSSHHRNQPLVRKGQPPYHEDYDTQPYSVSGLVFSLFIIAAILFIIAGAFRYVGH